MKLLTLFMGMQLGLSAQALANTPPQPPIAEVRPYTVSSAHGERQDPYYWLRDDSRSNPEVIAYLEAENSYYQAYQEPYSALVEELTAELIGRIQQDDSTVPYVIGDYLYSSRVEAGKEYAIYVRTPVAGGEEEIILDVNTLAAGHAYFQVANWSVSPDQNKLAYLEDTSGRRQYQLRVKDLTTGALLPDTMTGLSSSLAWSADSQHLFVVENDPVTLLSTKVYRHQLGTAPEQRALVYQEQDNSFYMGVGNTRDRNFVVIGVSSTVSDEVRVLDARQPKGEFQLIAPRQRDFKYSVDHNAGRWIINTDWDAPNYRLMTVAHTKIGNREHWQELLAHDEQVFVQSFVAFDNYLAINERSNGLRRIRFLSWDKPEESHFVESDEPAYVMWFSANPETNSNWLRYGYTSLSTPASVYEVHMATGERRLLKEAEIPGGFYRSNYRTERVWVPVAGEVTIPVSLLYHKDFKQNGSAALYQMAYGSYGISMDPGFNANILSLVDRGFVYAIAHIRGGQEMGRQWYEDGKLLNKHNTFTDYIAVTDYLVKQQYVAGDKVFGMGGSAGGLLMGAVANMAPEKYLGLVAHVPFVDVVTTMLDESLPLTTNEYDEWGNPNEKQYYDYMLSYSPYDQVRKQAYPALFVTTGFHDSQVQYFEPAKWVAKLRTMNTSNQPILFRTTMEAGHGGRSGRFARVGQTAEEYAFILDLLQRQQP